MFDKDHPKTVYSVQPVSYGLLTTEDVANQIAAESSATPGDVKNVLDRYAYYVKENLKKGYNIQLLGFGNLSIRFITSGTVKTEAEATAKLIVGLVPTFNPSFKLINKKRIYDLLPLNQLAKSSIGSVQMGRGRMHNKELRTGRIRMHRSGHGQHARGML